MVFLSLSARLLVNVEALNMVESVGNVTRHRRTTIVIKQGGDYKKIEVPAVSGEALAHGYQESLVRAAEALYGNKPPVCEWCARGEFFKEMDDKHTIPEAKKVVKNVHEFEAKVVEKCLVEDIGGFLRAEKPPVKRTSRFYVGYMIPAYDSVQASSLESQFHVRHAPSESVKEESESEGERPRAAQMIYYVELGSAVYQLGFAIDLSGIGVTSMVKKEVVVNEEERGLRVRAALVALQQLIEGFYGAKRTRFMPVEEVVSLAVAVAHPLPFVLPPASSKEYLSRAAEKITKSVNKLKSLGVREEVHAYAYSSETRVPSPIEELGTPEDVLGKASEKALELLGLRP